MFGFQILQAKLLRRRHYIYLYLSKHLYMYIYIHIHRYIVLTQQTQMYKGFVRTINPEFIVSELRDKGGLLHGGFRIEAITSTRIKRVIIIHPSRAAVPQLPPRSSNDSTPKRPGAKSTYTNRVYNVIKFVSKLNYIHRTVREREKRAKE